MSITTIAPTSYLRNWAFVTSIIATIFMVDHYPSLFDPLAQVDNNTFPFHQHLKAACDLLLPPTRTCFLPFE